MNFNLVPLFRVRVSVLIEIANAENVIERLSTHRARVHAQRATKRSWNPLHPFKPAEIRGACGVSDFFQLRADAGRDLAALDVDLVECAAGRMRDHAANSAIAHE